MKGASCYLCSERNALFLYRKGDYSILECSNCNFLYVYPIPSKRQLNKFYKTFDYQNEKTAEPIIRKDAIKSLKKIEKHSRRGKNSLLDIGCGRGYFLDEARKLGWKVSGIDYSKKIIDYAKKRLDLGVRCVDIFKYYPKKKFDIVTLNQVIEHVSDPQKLIEKCYGLLKSKGIIYIATPNIDSTSARVLKEDFDHLIPPEHLGYFNKKTLSRALEGCCFKVLYTGSWSYREDLAGIIKRILKGSKNKVKISSGRDSIPNVQNMSTIKKIKYFLFDVVFCGIFYRILNLDSFGIMLEIIAIKK